jgi:hypothetical protein
MHFFRINSAARLAVFFPHFIRNDIQNMKPYCVLHVTGHMFHSTLRNHPQHCIHMLRAAC